LDPFCGTGTTLVECKKNGIKSIGVEPNPMAYFASRVKVNWDINPELLLKHTGKIAGFAEKVLKSQGLEGPGDSPLFGRSRGNDVSLTELSAEGQKLILKNSISPIPLHKSLTLLETIEKFNNRPLTGHERLALAKAVVFGASNLNFGPEVGVGTVRTDAPVVKLWLNNVREMAQDLTQLHQLRKIEAKVYFADARALGKVLAPRSIDAVITSPPYPNEKDYTRTTRLESVVLGLIKSKEELRAVKRSLIRSNTRGVYKDDRDDQFIAGHQEINRIAEMIERRRIELGKTSGFERLYGKVTKLYFGGMARHLSDLRDFLRPGAYLAYVVGDQASYLRVLIQTGRLIADLAENLGYQVVKIDPFRTRLATATRKQLREEVVVLRYPGSKK